MATANAVDPFDNLTTVLSADVQWDKLQRYQASLLQFARLSTDLTLLLGGLQVQVAKDVQSLMTERAALNAERARGVTELPSKLSPGEGQRSDAPSCLPPSSSIPAVLEEEGGLPSPTLPPTARRKVTKAQPRTGSANSVRDALASLVPERSPSEPAEKKEHPQSLQTYASTANFDSTSSRPPPTYSKLPTWLGVGDHRSADPRTESWWSAPGHKNDVVPKDDSSGHTSTGGTSTSATGAAAAAAASGDLRDLSPFPEGGPGAMSMNLPRMTGTDEALARRAWLEARGQQAHRHKNDAEGADDVPSLASDGERRSFGNP